jgi:hypothetical protein
MYYARANQVWRTGSHCRASSAKPGRRPLRSQGNKAKSPKNGTSSSLGSRHWFAAAMGRDQSTGKLEKGAHGPGRWHPFIREEEAVDALQSQVLAFIAPCKEASIEKSLLE